MQGHSKHAGQIVYDFDEFYRDYGDPAGQFFTFEVTSNAVTYVFARVTGEVDGNRVVFDLDEEDLVDTRKAN